MGKTRLLLFECLNVECFLLISYSKCILLCVVVFISLVNQINIFSIFKGNTEFHMNKRTSLMLMLREMCVVNILKALEYF